MKIINLILLLCATTGVHAETRTVRFLHINDLHAHLTSHADRVVDADGNVTIEERGGFARLATLLKQQRAENPNSITMNIGDTFHGGVEALFSMGNAIVPPVNALNIDVGVAGNWDYAFSPGLTRMRFGPVDIWGLMNKIDPVDRFGKFLPGIIDPEPDLLSLSDPRAFKIGFDDEENDYITDDNILARIMPIQRPNYINLGANIRDRFVPWNFMPATYTKEVDGVKVGFIGLTSDIIKDMHILMGLGFDITKGEDNYRKLVNKHAAELRAKGADIVVVMSELGIHKDYRLAQIIDKGAVDVFFSAHTHESTTEPLNSDSGALVVEAGNDGWLGQMDITVDENNNIVDKQWQLLAVDSSIAEDEEMKLLVEAARAPYLQADVSMIAPPFMMQRLNQPIDSVIGYTETTVDRKDALESTFNSGWTDMIRQLTGTDIAITPGFRMDTTLVEPGYMLEDNTIATGEITLEDAYRLFPVVYLMATGNIDGKGLREVLENQLSNVFSTDVFKHTGGWNNGISGVDVELDIAAEDGKRIKSLTYSSNGEPVNENDMLKVGGCMRTIDSFDRLCSIPGFRKVRPLMNPESGKLLWTALDAFVYSLSSGNFNGSRVSITDNSAEVRWPEAEFIQPLAGAVARGAGSDDGSDDNSAGNDDAATAEEPVPPFLASADAWLLFALVSFGLVRKRLLA